jgi:hypothetical protein
MFTFFSLLKKHDKKENKGNSLILEKLDRMITLLEQLLNQQQQLPEQSQQETKGDDGNTIRVDHVQIDHLENVIFRLDHIDIDELSGRLLIGTNISGPEDFAASFVQKMEQDTKKKTKAENSEMMPTFTETSTGYTFRNNG